MTPSASPTIALVGPGAIGTTIAAALHEAGRTPMLCGRTDREQLELKDADGTVVVPGPVLTDPASVAGTVDLVFLAVKATQLDAAAGWLAALCSPQTVVCVLQNGVEQVSMVTPLAPDGCTVLPSVIWFPAETQSDGSVLLRGEPRLTLPDMPAARLVGDALAGTRCTAEIAADFASDAWNKLLLNAVAGLMALTSRRSGMFRRPDIAQFARAYAQECLLVARAEGATLADDLPQQIVDGFSTRLADLGTSILADREAHRPMEWDIRNGVISRRGRAHGIPTPLSDVVTALLAATSDGPG